MPNAMSQMLDGYCQETGKRTDYAFFERNQMIKVAAIKMVKRMPLLPQLILQPSKTFGTKSAPVQHSCS